MYEYLSWCPDQRTLNYQVVLKATQQRQTVVTAHLRSEQLLLFAFVRREDVTRVGPCKSAGFLTGNEVWHDCRGHNPARINPHHRTSSRAIINCNGSLMSALYVPVLQ